MVAAGMLGRRIRELGGNTVDAASGASCSSEGRGRWRRQREPWPRPGGANEPPPVVSRGRDPAAAR